MRKKSLKHNQNKPLMNLNENTNSSIKNFLFTTSIDIFPRSDMYIQLYNNNYRNDPEHEPVFVLIESRMYSNHALYLRPNTVEWLIPAPVDHVRIMLMPIDQNYYPKKEREFITLSNPSPSSSNFPDISYEVEVPPAAVVRLDVLSGGLVLGTKLGVNTDSIFNKIIEGSISNYYEPDTFQCIFLQHEPI
ncbi:hypothetical protein [Bacillus cereus group sp. BfR-BA-01354]|uniref:hypothetical protein n=1 Tax=Bacillus cereus group sp. BfR-BA-01354 TaxID=2920317 RepID=UPI001F59650D